MWDTVQGSAGPKVVPVLPRVISLPTAQSMAAAKGEAAATSVNLGAAGTSVLAPGFTFSTWGTFFAAS